MTESTSDIAATRKRKLMNRSGTAFPLWDPAENFATGCKDFYKSAGTLELRIDQFAVFTRDEKFRYSEPIYIRGLPWIIGAFPNKAAQSNNHDGQTLSKVIGLYLWCNKGSTSQTWECQATFTLRVVSQIEGARNIIARDKNQSFSGKQNCNAWGVTNLAKYDKLLDPEEGYIKDDTIVLQVDVEAKIPHGIHQDDVARSKTYNDIFGHVDKSSLFSSSTKYPWDFVLVVQDKKVHVCKAILSLHSEYFKDQFAEDENSESATLLNTDYNEFVELLCIIYPTFYPITVENVETIAKLANEFKIHGILRQCEAVLTVNSTIFGRLRKFLLSYWYGLAHLKEKYLAELRAINGLKHLKKELEYAALDCRTKAILLDEIVENSRNTSYDAPPTINNEKTLNRELIPNARAIEISDKLASSALAQSDGVLIVESKRIPVLKSYLAMYSKYFNTLFLGEFKERNQDEIVLEEISYTDILELLAVIYPCCYPVTDENLETILKLADRFIMPIILERCKEVLKSSQNIKRALKLYLAQRYNFPDLQIEYAQQFKSVKDVKQLKADTEYGLLDDKSRSLIFDRIIS